MNAVCQLTGSDIFPATDYLGHVFILCNQPFNFYIVIRHSTSVKRIWSQTSPHPSVRTVPLAELREALPADTPVVTPEQRRRGVAARQEHVARREPAT